MIKVEHISKQFKKVKAVDDVSLEVKKGEIVCLIGPSGSGKSTVLRCIHGLEVPETGYVYLNGEALDPKKSNYQELRNKMGFVFQHFNLFPHMTVLENLTLSLTKVRHMDEEKANEMISRAEILAKEIRLGSIEYAEDVLTTVEHNLKSILQEVERNRIELNPGK